MAMTAAAVGGELLACRHRLTGLAAVVVREHHLADDVFQQVVVQALEDPARFNDPTHLLRWALRAARHRAVDVARARRRIVLDDSVYELLEEEAADTKATDMESRLAALRLCVDALPAKARRLLRLRYQDGAAGADVARQVGSTAGAVYQALSRLHHQLRRCVENRVGAAPAPDRT